MRRIKAIHAAVILTMMVGWAYADSVEVTFTGVVTWTFPDSQIEAMGIRAGDSFTSLLTYDPNQMDQDPTVDVGRYFTYSFSLTIATSSGDVTIPGSDSPNFWPILIRDNDPTLGDRFGNQGNGGGLSHFSFQDLGGAMLSSDLLSDIDWATISPGAGTVHARATNAAITITRGGSTAGSELRVRVNYPYSFLVFPNLADGFASSLTLSAKTTMRLE